MGRGYDGVEVTRGGMREGGKENRWDCMQFGRDIWTMILQYSTGFIANVRVFGSLSSGMIRRNKR